MTRRLFLAGVGMSALAASPLVRLTSLAYARTSAPAGPCMVGLTGRFDLLAKAEPRVALRSFDHAAELPAALLRFPVDWAEAEPEPGLFDFGKIEQLTEQLVFHGFGIVPVLLGAPSWVKRRRAGETAIHYPAGEGAAAKLGEFSARLVGRLWALGTNVRGVEVWSQPNARNGAFVPPKELALMTGAVTSALGGVPDLLRPQDPLTVVSGGVDLDDPANDWQAYLTELASAGPKSQAVGVHTYPGRAQQLNGEGLNRLESVTAALDQASAITGSPVWVTATGAFTGRRAMDHQPANLEAIVAALRASPACAAVIVGGVSGAAEAESTGLDRGAETELLSSDGAQTPAFRRLLEAFAE